MLPGCIMAGVGLGLTNTPVTNTTTGAVPAARSGMASGIDMSARMISLAINIPIMGFILVEGVRSSLIANLPRGIDAAGLRVLAETVAAGTTCSTSLSRPCTKALTEGFGRVMLYGGISSLLLAVASFITFGRSHARQPHTVVEPGGRLSR